MIMIVISFALVTFYAFAILYVLIVMQIKLVVVVVVVDQTVYKPNATQVYPTLAKCYSTLKETSKNFITLLKTNTHLLVI